MVPLASEKRSGFSGYQWCHWLPMVPLVKFPMVPLGESRTHAIIDVTEINGNLFHGNENIFFSFRFISKTGHSIAQNRQRDNILKHFIGLTSDLRLKKRIQDRSKQPPQDFCCTFIHFSSAPVLGITDLQHNSSWLRQKCAPLRLQSEC